MLIVQPNKLNPIEKPVAHINKSGQPIFSTCMDIPTENAKLIYTEIFTIYTYIIQYYVYLYIAKLRLTTFRCVSFQTATKKKPVAI